MVKAGRADAQFAGQAAQTRTQGSIQLEPALLDTTAVTLHFLQAQRQCRLLHVGKHLAEEAFMGRLTDGHSGLGDIATIWHRRVEPGQFTAQNELHFMLHHFQRGMVEGDVVEQQDRDPATVRFIMSASHAHQRSLSQVETAVTRIEQCLQLAGDITQGRIQLKGFDDQAGLAQHHLHRLLQAIPDQRSTKNVVTIDNALQRSNETVELCPAVHGESSLQQVRITLPGRNMVVENPFLQWRKRVDILNIGRTARHGGNDPLDSALLQVQQGEH
ncbi:hypothetical protein PSCICN_09310 [Pseudomonas cichorii]|nr:hypothetical protein PSCICN_09310 [Pseudomonas cichorii]